MLFCNVYCLLISRAHSSTDPIPGGDIAKIGGEAYKKSFVQPFTLANNARLLSEFTSSYKDKLEERFESHSFCIYTLISNYNKLSRRSIGLIKSECGYDSATQLYLGATEADRPDILSLVAATRSRQEKIPQEMKDSKESVRSSISDVIANNLQGKVFNEAANKFIATNISKKIKNSLKDLKCRYTIGTIILEASVEYIDNVVNTPGQDVEVIHVTYKNEEFNIAVFIAFVSLS